MSALPRFDDIHDALLGRGFTQANTVALQYRGVLNVCGETIPVYIDFADAELQSLPIIRLDQLPAWVPPGCNHILSGNVICYANSKLAFVDRYDAGPQILGCLDSATAVLLDVKRGNVAGDVNGEFAAYWRGDGILLDAPPAITFQALKVVTLALPAKQLHLLCSTGIDAIQKYTHYSPQETEAAAFLLPSQQPLLAGTSDWPPQTLQSLTHWLQDVAPALLREFRVALAQLNGRWVNRVFVIVQAKPTWVGFSFDLPMHARTVKFRHQKGFINAIWSRSAGTAVKRYLPLRIDTEYLVDRNLRDEEKSLLAKRILLVGCGAIGGHVAHGLARCGAGFGGGSLTLIDPDFFSGGNIGRHRLGFDALLSEKSQALAQDLTRSLPGIDVRPRTGSALDLPLKHFDLIIDATGEEQLSEALNARFVVGESPPILFVWINGNGTSVQSFMLANEDQGCLHCWKSHGTRRDFDPSANSPVDIRIGRGCDDAYTPFNGGAALTAAGLAIQAVTDWVSGVPEPTLRSIQIDYKMTQYIKPKSPRKTPSCPACGPKL